MAIARIGSALDLPVTAYVETPDGALDDYVDFPVTWVDPPEPGESGLADLVRTLDWPAGDGYFWMAGESAQMREIRRHVRHDLGRESAAYDVMGYWSGSRGRQRRAVDPGPIWLAGKGWQATAVDFSAVAAWRGGKMTATAGVKVEWVVADVRTYQPKPEAFDAVLVAYLHLPPDELAAVLDRAARAVAPGGRLIVVGHDRTNLTEGIGGPQDPEVLYTPEAVGAALTGLTVQRAERVHRTVSTEEGPRQAVDTLVRATRE